MSAQFKSEPIFKQIKQTLSSNEALSKALIKKSNSVIVFNLKNKQGQTKAWKLDLKSKGELTNASKSDFESSDLVITIKDLDFKKLVNGKVNSQKLFLSGKLKVKGDVMKAATIETILKKVSPVKAKL